MNPPYATANNLGTKEGDHKGGVANTKVEREMDKEKWGASKRNLYAQFLYRCWKMQQHNKNIRIAVFAPPLFMTGVTYKEFRKKFFDSFEYKGGFLFQASHFSGVSSDWGITLTVWDQGATAKRDEFPLKVIELTSAGINKTTKKIVYNTDNEVQLSGYTKNIIKKTDKIDYPKLSSAVNVQETNYGVYTINSIGSMMHMSNIVMENNTGIAIFSGCVGRSGNFPIEKTNFHKTTTLFTARKSIVGNWINDKDEYLAPNENHSDWQQFVYDSIVYSLFNNSSQQSSLRQITYKNKKWDIRNEFFWMSKDQMLELANDHGFDEMYQDARTDNDRFVYKKLYHEDVYGKLSPDAREVLLMAEELVKKSMEARIIMAGDDDKLHLHCWDAGYAQLKLVWKASYKQEFNEFREAYKRFEQRLIPMVYELGFLRR